MFKLTDQVKDEHWFWDTELMVLAQSRGFKVKEFPVNWRHGGTTKVNLKKDILDMGSQIFRLWWILNRQSKEKAIKSLGPITE